MDKNQQTQTYYEGSAEKIYRSVFGATMHLAMFEGNESRQVAQTRTKEFLLDRVPGISPGTSIIDLGSGYGDTARFVAHRLGCRVIGINLVHTQNVTALNFSRQAGMGNRVFALEADFGRVPLPSACTPVVWSQEALLHAPDRGRVLQEAARLLNPGGIFIFTDILQTGPMQPTEASLIYERVKIDSLETFESYRAYLQAAGLHIREVADLSQYVARSYGDYMNGVRQARNILDEAIGPDFVNYTVEAVGRWVTAAEAGKLGWGMFVAQKPKT